MKHTLNLWIYAFTKCYIETNKAGMLFHTDFLTSKEVKYNGLIRTQQPKKPYTLKIFKPYV